MIFAKIFSIKPWLRIPAECLSYVVFVSAVCKKNKKSHQAAACEKIDFFSRPTQETRAAVVHNIGH